MTLNKKNTNGFIFSLESADIQQVEELLRNSSLRRGSDESPGSKKPSSPAANSQTMELLLRDTLGMGALLWLAGYLASMAVYFSPFSYAIWGRVVLVLYIPAAAWVAWRYFTGRALSLWYYTGVGIAWSLIAVVLDYPFIVLRFGAWEYYTPDVYLYYAVMFLIPAGVGMYLRRAGAGVRS